MLTKNDLSQIRGVVKDEVGEQLDSKLAPIKKDIKSLKKDVSQIKRDQNSMLIMLDKEQMQQRKRITRLEEHVGLPIPQ